MTPRRSIIGVIADSRWFSNDLRRRLVLLATAIIIGLLALFPRPYRATATLAPQSASTAGLGGMVGQLGATYAAILASQQPVEIDLAVMRSIQVRRSVIQRVHLLDRSGYRDEARAMRRLESKVTPRILRGSLIELTVKDRDPDFALALVRAYAAAGQERLSDLTREQIAYKRSILQERMRDATDRLSRAEYAFDQFRRQHALAEPSEQLGATSARITALQGEIKTKQVELETARRFATDQTMSVKSILTEITALRRQLAEVQNLSNTGDSLTLAGAVSQTTQNAKLFRELRFAQGLYDSYTRFLEGAAVEQLTADYNMRYLEPPYIDPDRQFNLIFLALFLLIVALGVATEFYLARPPVGALRTRIE